MNLTNHGKFFLGLFLGMMLVIVAVVFAVDGIGSSQSRADEDYVSCAEGGDCQVYDTDPGYVGPQSPWDRLKGIGTGVVGKVKDKFSKSTPTPVPSSNREQCFSLANSIISSCYQLYDAQQILECYQRYLNQLNICYSL